MRYLLLAAVTLYCLTGRAEEGQSVMKVPAESEFGNIFLMSLLMATRNSPPDAISIYPVLYKKNGERHATNSLFIVITGDDIGKFYEELSKPTQIAIAPESCPNIIMERGGSDPARTQLRGSVVVNNDAKHVRFRLVTGSPIFPTMDFVYGSGAMKKFLLDRQVLLQK